MPILIGWAGLVAVYNLFIVYQIYRLSTQAMARRRRRDGEF